MNFTMPSQRQYKRYSRMEGEKYLTDRRHSRIGGRRRHLFKVQRHGGEGLRGDGIAIVWVAARAQCRSVRDKLRKRGSARKRCLHEELGGCETEDRDGGQEAGGVVSSRTFKSALAQRAPTLM